MELKKLNSMYTVELLNESKFAKPVILNWFKQQMLNSFQETELTKEQIEQYIEDTLAEKTFVSKSAIHRFCKKIGLKGFNELKVILAKDISEMKSDIEIAQEAAMIPVKEVAARYGIKEDDLELYGKYKAKITLDAWQRVKDRPNGKLVLVTAINPTPAGEGKTTTSVGLADAFARQGKKTAVALREPSLGPCFGLKGGAARAQKLTAEERSEIAKKAAQARWANRK